MTSHSSTAPGVCSCGRVFGTPAAQRQHQSAKNRRLERNGMRLAKRKLARLHLPKIPSGWDAFSYSGDTFTVVDDSVACDSVNRPQRPAKRAPAKRSRKRAGPLDPLMVECLQDLALVGHDHEDRLAVLTKWTDVVIRRVSRSELTNARAAHLARNRAAGRGPCWVCAEKTKRIWHHVIQLQYGGPNHDANLLPICELCHCLIHPWLQDGYAEEVARQPAADEAPFIITLEWMRRFGSGGVAWTDQQRKVIGAPTVMKGPKGWLRGMVGKVITQPQRMAFEEFAALNELERARMSGVFERLKEEDEPVCQPCPHCRGAGHIDGHRCVVCEARALDDAFGLRCMEVN